MPDSNYEMLVKNIKMLMQNKSMIPADLIHETGIAQSQVIKALSLTQKPQFTFEQIWTIADYFNVSINYLVGRKSATIITEQSRNKKYVNFLCSLLRVKRLLALKSELRKICTKKSWSHTVDIPVNGKRNKYLPNVLFF